MLEPFGCARRKHGVVRLGFVGGGPGAGRHRDDKGRISPNDRESLMNHPLSAFEVGMDALTNQLNGCGAACQQLVTARFLRFAGRRHLR